MTVDRWSREADASVRAFAERAVRWNEHPGDQEFALVEPWTDPDHSAERLDAAYRSGIVPPEQRSSVPIRPAAPLDIAWDADLADAIGIEGLPARQRTGRTARPRDAALHYTAIGGWRLFPCRQGDKHPLTKNGFHDASADPDQIRSWWRKHPDALIGWWPGPSDIAVLDIDRKHGKDGLATFARLDGCPILPATPTVHTPSGGLHLHFRMPAERIGITTGAAGRGVGIGLDWRGDLGYAILPSPGSGYRWGRWHYGNCSPVPVPASLMPREPPVRPATAKPVRPTIGLSVYASAALDSAERAILGAPAGQQETTLHRECFLIGALAGAGGLPADLARGVLHNIASRVPDLDPSHPWPARQLHQKIERSFSSGFFNPRKAPANG